MITSSINKRARFFFVKLLLLITVISISLAACSGDANESGRFELSNDTINSSESAQEIESIAQNTPTPLPTADPKVALLDEMLLLARQANDSYIYGDMTTWRETVAEIVSIGEEWDEMKADLDTSNYELFGYDTEEDFLAQLGNIVLIDAYIKYTNSDEDDALVIFNNAIDSAATQLSAAYSGRGHMYRLQGNPNKALEDFDQAIALNSENADAYRGKAMIYYYDQNNITTADEFLEQALEINPQFGRIFILQGDIAYYELGDVNSAEALYEQGIQYEPGYADGYYSLAFLFDRVGRDEECIDEINSAIDLKPNYGWYYDTRGYCRLGLKQYAIALDDFDKAISLGSDSSLLADAYAGKGHAYYDSEIYDLAIDAYAAAINQNPNNPLYHEWRADAYRQVEDYSKAIAGYTDVLSLDLSRSWAYYGLGTTYDRMDNYQDAYNNYEIFLEMEPGDIPATRYACDRMNALHLFNSQNLLDMFLGSGCNRFPSDSSGSITSGTNNDSEDLSNCTYGIIGDRCMTWLEYDQAAHTP